MDRLEAMSLLVAAAEAGSLSAASRRLGTPLASVSRKVSELEAHLCTKLLVRTSRRLMLTTAGESYVAACKRILEQVGEAERMAAGEYSAPRGDLMLTAPIVLGRLHVLPVITEFLATYPEINLRMVLSDRVVHLIDDHIDLAVRIGELPDSSLRATRLTTVRRVVCGSPAYFAAQGVPVKPDELSGLSCITFDGITPAGSWSFAGAKNKSDLLVAIRPRLSVNTAEAAIDSALAGLGVTRVLSYQVASHVSAGKLRIVLAQFEPPPLPVSLVYATQGLLPRKMQVFLDFAIPRLRDRFKGK
jgi:DNA-binding transcriptional LysR family regulator